MRRLDKLVRERQGGPVRADGGSARIVTASPLAEAEKGAWTEELRARLGDGVTPEFSVDPGFIAGAELRLRQGRIRFAWADELEEAERLLAASEAAG
jgi:F0F1-type ATP synthase delta subunit